MKNLLQLYLLVALAAAPSLAADMSPRPLFNRHFQPMHDRKPRSENFYSGIVPATEASGLGKRQTECLPGNYFCPNTNKCCPIGYACVGDGVNSRCISPDAACEPGLYNCPDGLGCCEIGHECQPGTNKCLGSCDVGSTPCFDGCCSQGHFCDLVNPTHLCVKKEDTMSNSTTAPAPTTSKAITSGTAPFGSSTKTSVRPTSTNPNPKPASPATTEGENSSSSTEPVIAGSTSSATAQDSGINALKPGRWLGGFGILFFSVFFHM